MRHLVEKHQDTRHFSNISSEHLGIASSPCHDVTFHLEMINLSAVLNVVEIPLNVVLQSGLYPGLYIDLHLSHTVGIFR